MGEVECSIRLYRIIAGLGVCYLLAGMCRWHGAKSCLGPGKFKVMCLEDTTIVCSIYLYKSNIHGRFYFCCLIRNITISSNCCAQFYKSYMHGHFDFCCLIGNTTISSNCRAQFYKSYMHGHFYFCCLIGNIAICSNCSAQFCKSYVPGYFYFSQLSYIVSVL